MGAAEMTPAEARVRAERSLGNAVGEQGTTLDALVGIGYALLALSEPTTDTRTPAERERDAREMRWEAGAA